MNKNEITYNDIIDELLNNICKRSIDAIVDIEIEFREGINRINNDNCSNLEYLLKRYRDTFDKLVDKKEDTV